MKLTQLILEGLTYKVPNFDYEWEEAVRYPEFKKLGKHDWIELATKGREVTITSAKDINNTDANNPNAFKSLNKDKRERTLAQIQSGTVEMPIVAKYPDGYKELLGGNTRLTALMAKNGKATIWMFDVPEDILDENYADGKAGLIQQFRQEVGPKQCSIYDKRDNCGPATLDFISWAKSKGIKDLKRIDGYFKADIPVSSKKDFTREMKQEFLNDGGDWNNAKERFKWISKSKYAEQWKYIPHYWVEDSNGKIYDPTGQQQFIDAGYAKDLNPDRYVLTDIGENYADGKVKGKSRPGRVKKAGASCKGSVSDLRAKAKKYGGEKGKMYHWCANMKGGKK